MFNLSSILTPEEGSILSEPMCVAEIFPKRNDVFLLPYFSSGEGATASPDRKPQKYKLNEVCADIENEMIVVGQIKLESFKEVLEESLYDGKDKLLPSAVERDRRLAIVEALLDYEDELFYPAHGKSPIRRVARKFNTTKTCVQRYLNTYVRGGRQKNALITSRGRHSTSPSPSLKKRGRPRKSAVLGVIGKNVDEQDKKFMKRILKRDYINGKKSLEKCHSALINEHYYLQKGSIAPDGTVTNSIPLPQNECISLNQLRDWLPKLFGCSMKNIHAIRRQKPDHDANYAGRAGHSDFEADGPGDIWMMDSTEIDIELVSPYNRQAKIVTATLYVTRDGFSRSICGIYLAYGKPSWKEARLALFHAIRKKVEFAKEYGLDISKDDWVECKMPRELLVDNEEFQNKISESVGKDLGLKVTYSRAYRGDDKGLAESSFNMIHAMAKNENIPGFKYKGLIGRNRNLPMNTACLTLYEMQQILIIYAIYHNNHVWKDDFPIEESALKSGLDRVCRQYWDWGIKNRNYYLQKKTDRQLYVSLLEVGTLTVHKTHLHLQEVGTNYYCEEIRASKFQDKPRLPNSKSHKTLSCRYMRSGLGKILIDFRGQFVVGFLHSNHTRECSKMSVAEFDEWKDELKIRKDIFKHENMGKAHDFSNQIQHIVNNAKNEKSKAKPAPLAALPSKKEVSEELIHEADALENERYEGAILFDSDEPIHLSEHETLESDNIEHDFDDDFDDAFLAVLGDD
jgi:hypothetical protein